MAVEHAGFKLGLFRHHLPLPGRVKHQFHNHLAHVGHLGHAVFHIAHQYRAHAAAGRRERHTNIHPGLGLVDPDAVD